MLIRTCVNVHAATSAQRSPHTSSEVCLSWLRAVTSHTSVLMPLVKYAFVNFWVFVKKLVMLMLFTTAAVSFHSNCVEERWEITEFCCLKENDDTPFI